MIHVAFLERTCIACPSAWEGLTSDGRVIYARYRHGRLTVGVGTTISQATRATFLQEAPGCVLKRDVHREDDSFMELEQLRQLTAGLVEWPADVPDADELTNRDG